MRNKDKNIINIIKKNKVLLIVFVLLIVLAFISVFENKDASELELGADKYSAEYIEELENKLETVILGINGIESCETMITLESGIEYIYASDVQQSLTSNENKKESSEEKNSLTVLSDKQTGEKAVVIKEIYPEIKGVAAICSGDNTSSVTLAVSGAISKVLGVGADKVCVIIE